MDSSEFEFEGLQDCDSIVKYLDALKKGFKQKKIVLGTDDEVIELCPDGLLSFSLEVKHKKNRNKISIKIGWRDSSAGSEAPILDIKSDD